MIVTVLVATAAIGSQIPKLQANFTPSDLFARLEGQDRVAAEFQEAFGNTDNVLLVLVEAEDVLSVEPLQYLHELSLHFASQDELERVTSVTITPLPRPAPPTEEPSQDESGERDGGGGFGRAVRGLGGLFTTEPATDDGPSGFGLVIPNMRIDPIVRGEVVEPEEAEELRAALADAPLVEGKLISADRQVAAVALVLGRDVTRNEQIESEVRTISDYVASHPPPDGSRVLLAGLPYVRFIVVTKMRQDQTIMIPAALLVCLIILLISFRWLPGVIFPTVAIGLSAIMVVGGMAIVGETVNIINNIVPMLVLIIGISSSIHLVNRFGEEFRSSQDRAAASRRSLRAMTVALFLTSFTTAVGFGALIVSATPMLRRFGLTAAIGVIIAYIVSITFLPALLTFAKAPRRWHGKHVEGRLENLISRTTRLVLRMRWAVLGVSTVILALAVFFATDLEVNSAVLDQLGEDDEIVQTTRLIEQHLEGIRPLEVSLTSDTAGRFDEPDALNAIARIQVWAERQPGVLGTTSYADFIAEARYRLSAGRTPRDAVFVDANLIRLLGGALAQASRNVSPTAPYVTDDRTRARVNIMVEDMGSRATNLLIEQLEEELDAVTGGLDGVEVALTGDAYVGSMGLKLVMRDLFSSLLTAFLIIFGFLALVLRSPRLGLLSIPPNIIPLVGTMAYMVVRGIPLNLATVIIFSISIGMAVDGTIHVLARFREEIARVDTVDEALLRAARGTGKAILFTCLSLMLGFGVMLLSSFPPVRRFGELIAVTMGTCLLATLVLVPAMLRIWWKHSGPTAEKSTEES